jgi:hypothetical protein
MKIKAWIDDKSHEYLLNLVAQEYYGEAWELITRLTIEFNKSLYIIAGEVFNGTNRK